MDFHSDDDDFRIERRAQLGKQRRLVWVLSLAGLLPFIACTLVLLILGIENSIAKPTIEIFRNYSVVILSFLGGIRWGHALLRHHDERTELDFRSNIFSVIPPLIAWVSMFFSAAPALGILLLAFCTQGAWDSFSSHLGRLPKWFAPVRIALTACVAACHIAVFLILA